nr:tetratricopeptide repeat protein [Bacteroidota bacterium]
LMNEGPDRYDKIMNDLKQGRYKKAQASLEVLLVQEPANDTLRYFSGIVATELAQFDRAIVHFGNVPVSSVFVGKAQYQTAICHLHEGRADSAKTLLEKVSRSGDHQLSARARELLDRL